MVRLSLAQALCPDPCPSQPLLVLRGHPACGGKAILPPQRARVREVAWVPWGGAKVTLLLPAWRNPGDPALRVLIRAD